ncbi:MAG: PAS domain S-box protein, partial [Bacteroidota bacterium]
KYAELYDFAPTGYFSLSREGMIIELNLYASKMLGKERSYLINKPFGSYFSNETKPFFNLFLGKIFNGETKETCELTLRENGKVPFYVYLTGIVTEKGEQCLVTMVDITERKLAEQALIESSKELAFQNQEKAKRVDELADAHAKAQKLTHELEVHQIELEMQNNELLAARIAAESAAEKYLELYDFAPTGYLSLSNLGKITEINQYGAQMLGKERLFLQGAKFGLFVSANTKPIFNQFFDKVFNGKLKESCEIIMVSKANQPITVQLTGIVTEKGDQCLVNMVDITERKQAEGVLYESEANLRIAHLYTRSLIEASLDPLVTINVDGKILDVNQATENATGLLRTNLTGTYFSDYFTEPEKAKMGYQKAFEDGNVLDYPLTILHASGKLTDVLYNATVFKDEHGKILGVFAAARDITLRKKLEEERTQQSVLITMLLDSIPDIIFFKDTEGVYLGCNPPFAAFVGKSRNEIIGKTDYDLFDKDIADSFRLHDKEMLKQNLPRHNEEWVTYPDGRKILLDMLKTPYWSSDGSLIGMLGISRDITERKDAEREMLENNARFSSMIANISDVIGIMGADGIMTYKSPNIEKWFGWLPQDRVGTSGFSTVHPDDLDRVGKVFYSLLEKDDAVKTLEFRYQCKDGSYKPIELTAANLLNDPFIHGVLLNYRDISKRKQIEEELQQISTRLLLATTAGGVGVWDYDIVNNILLWDDQMIALYGLDKKNFSGAYEAWLSGIHPDDLVRGDKELQMAISGKKDFNAEFRVLWPDGTVRYIRALAIVQRDDSGKALRMIGTNWDITNQKNTEQALLESKDVLQKINAEKDKFFSIIAHDLRSPFNVFLNFSQMLAEDLPTLQQEQIQRIAVSMQNSAINLFRLLENLLEWSLMQRGITRFEPETCILMTEISESMTSVIDPAKKKGIQIIYHVPEDLVVFADENMLRGIIRNLASNAVKFTPKFGTITIAAKQLPDKSVELSFKDTGIGMSREMIDDLFKLDVNTSRRGTEDEPSTGLGLIICKDFIEKHDGKFWVESEEGKGSVFYFTIPCNAEVQNQWNEFLGKPTIEVPRQTMNLPEEIKPLKILIVEDDVLSDFLILAIVEKYSREILHVKTGVKAISAFHSNPDIDLVLMDINMPEMDGYEATRQIRRFNKNVIIIAQTAYALNSDRQMAIDSGCNDYISKPIDKDELQGLIRKYFIMT